MSKFVYSFNIEAGAIEWLHFERYEICEETDSEPRRLEVVGMPTKRTVNFGQIREQMLKDALKIKQENDLLPFVEQYGMLSKSASMSVKQILRTMRSIQFFLLLNDHLKAESAIDKFSCLFADDTEELSIRMSPSKRARGNKVARDWLKHVAHPKGQSLTFAAHDDAWDGMCSGGTSTEVIDSWLLSYEPPSIATEAKRYLFLRYAALCFLRDSADIWLSDIETKTEFDWDGKFRINREPDTPWKALKLAAVDRLVTIKSKLCKNCGASFEFKKSQREYCDKPYCRKKLQMAKRG